MDQTVPFTWTAFVERLRQDVQQAFAEHPPQAFPGPVMPYVTKVQGVLYMSSLQNLVLADPRIHAIGNRRLTELSETELQRLKAQRRKVPRPPLGWARVRNSILLYVRNHTAIPGAIAAHVLGRRNHDEFLWHAEDPEPNDRPNPVVIDYPDSDRPALAYIMPTMADEIPPWNTLSAQRHH